MPCTPGVFLMLHVGAYKICAAALNIVGQSLETKTTPVGFEPARGDPIGLAGRRLNRSAKVSLCIATSNAKRRCRHQACRGINVLAWRSLDNAADAGNSKNTGLATQRCPPKSQTRMPMHRPNSIQVELRKGHKCPPWRPTTTMLRALRSTK